MKYNIRLFLSRALVISLYSFIVLASLRTQKAKSSNKKEILLTGTFYSANWVEAHVVPLTKSLEVERVYVVATDSKFDIPGVELIEPSESQRKLFGNTVARLIVFITAAFRIKPSFIGGFHLLFNGTISILLSKLLGVRSIYFSVGGITETLVAGKTENAFFSFIRKYDPVLTTTLCKIIKCSTIVVTMGEGAKEFLVSRGVPTERVHVISGAIDRNKFRVDASVEKKYDAILTARLTEVKQVHVFIDIAARIKELGEDVSFAVLGDGPLKSTIEDYAHQRNVAECVDFLGHQTDICNWLNRSKLFVLTSRSEGLSLAMMEAMTCGLPAIVPNVGDLADLVCDGRNGYLIDGHDIDEFSAKIIMLLTSPDVYDKVSAGAVSSTLKYDVSNVIATWDSVLA